MKPNNYIYLKCTSDSLYRIWMEFLTPFHKLTAREKDVAARIIEQYFRLKESISDPEVLRDLLWSRKSRKDIMTSLKMSQPHFQLILARLKTVGFLIDGDINPRYLPHKVDGESRLALQIIYDWSNKANPIGNAMQ